MIPVYREKDTFLMRLNPVAQLAIVISLMVISLISDNPLCQIAVILATAILACAAGVFGEWASWWKLCAVIGLAALIINPLVSRQGATVIWRGPRVPVLGRLDITLEAIAYGGAMALRLAAIIWVFALLSLIMNPDNALGLLKGRGSRSALVSALAVRMVPTTMRDASLILDAQRARGVARDEGSRLQVLRSRIPLVKRLVSTALDRSIGLAEAMEARAYGSHRRTRLRESRFGAGDVGVVIASVAMLGACVAGIACGFLSFTFYPSVTASFTGLTVAFAVLPVAVALLLLFLSESWKKWTWLKLRI